MNRHIKKILFVAFVTLQLTASAQQVDIQKYSLKKFISKVAILGGPSLLLPYEDSGYADSFRNDYNAQGINANFQIKDKFGTSAGLAAFHSLGKRWEIEGRLMYEKKGYIEITEIDRPGDYRKTQYNFKNSYLTISLMPNVAIGSERRLFLYSGVLYNYLLHSMSVDTDYVNGLKTNLVTTQYTKSSGQKNKLNGSIIVGIGYPVTVSGKVELCFYLQGNYGIGNIEEWKFLKMKSNSVSLLVGLKMKR